MLKTVFTVKLNEKILSRKVSVGKFDGQNPCLTAATTTDKVFVHNPHSRSLNPDGRWVMGSSANDINFLNINQKVNAITAGKLKPFENENNANNANNDVLVIGTPTSILVYDVLNNTDLFYKEIPDGANTVLIGEIGTIKKPLAIIGGNCSLQGFDCNGNDCYWTVTGDNITSMALADIDEDGQYELLVGSDDHEIRIFKEDAITWELSETDTITCLCAIGPQTFAYALANGTVGVYHRKERLWRIKSKNQAISLTSYDVNGDGNLELVTGWNNGKIDARNVDNGEVMFRDNLQHPIAGILVADYNLDGIDELIVCTVEGEIRGYVAASPQERQAVIDANYEQETIRELMKRKQNLALELRNYEENIRIQQVADPFIAKGKPTQENDQFGAIPANTQLKSALIISQNDKLPSVELSLQTTNDTIIRAVVIFAEGIFKGESQIIHPKESEAQSEMTIPLRPTRDMPIDLHIKALVGYKFSYHYHVFELTRHLPRFSMYAVSKVNETPKSYVRFALPEKIPKVVMWLNANFLLVEEFDVTNTLNVSFISLRDGKPLIMEMDGKSGLFHIKSDNIELAGDIVQSLVCEFLTIEDMPTSSHFPYELEKLYKLINRVEELQNVKQALAAEIADNSSAIRALVVRAEDARLIGEYKMMKQFYSELNALNTDVINEYKIRCQNQNDLVDSLKQMNVIIQKAANLRVGNSKTQMVQACREAIKQNNLNMLSKIINMEESE